MNDKNKEQINNLVSKKDYYSICELISNEDNLDLDYIFDKIIKTKDKEFIFYILNSYVIRGIVDDKYFSRLEKAIKK